MVLIINFFFFFFVVYRPVFAVLVEVVVVWAKYIGLSSSSTRRNNIKSDLTVHNGAYVNTHMLIYIHSDTWTFTTD